VARAQSPEEPDLIPPPALLASGWFPFILNFYWKVAGVFFRYPGRVGLSSWFRTPEMNRTAGGSPESQHLFGLAMDLTMAPAILPDVTSVAQQNGLVAVQERGHVHVQAFPAGALARAGVRFPS